MARQVETAPDLSINRIVDGTQIEGEIRCESNIRIDGTFTGTITTKGRFVVGPSGKVDGTVNCQNAEVEGLVKGKITVQQQLTLKGSAKVEGDIFTDKLSIEPGAIFTGACSMGGKVKEMKKDGSGFEGAKAGATAAVASY
ncbi:MAG: polymer-forming cytoskeletal protein [Flavobacteriales bacterium]|nr:polymer-forming cytoskeletal protein [Flavobacteriales bacterium]